MKPQFKKYLLLLVAILVATVALYAQSNPQQKATKKQEQTAVTPINETQGESAMMDCCKNMAKAESETEDMDMMKMCHSMMSKMDKAEKSGNHPVGCNMMNKAKSEGKVKTRQ